MRFSRSSVVSCFSACLTLLSSTIFSPRPSAAAQADNGSLKVSLTSFDADGDNALNVSDYARAQELFSNRLKNLGAAKGTFTEVGLRTGLFESLVWQGKLSEAAAELKRIHKVLDPLTRSAQASEAEQVNLLNARVLDAQSWLEEGSGQRDKAIETLMQAISLLKQEGIKETETWRLVTCMGHLASLRAGQGAYGQAASLLQEALDQAKGSSTIAPTNIADIEEQLGSMLFKMGKAAEAAPHFQRSLAIDNAGNAVLQRYSPKPYWLYPTYRYIEGSPWSDSTLAGGVMRKRIALNTVTVEVSAIRDNSAQAKGKVVRVGVVVKNRSDRPIEFMGRKPEFMVVTPKVVAATMIEPLQMAQNVEKKADGKAKWVRFWGQDATQTVSSTYMNQPMYGYGFGGFYPPVMSYGGTIPTVMRNGNMTTVMTQVPDYAAQQRAMEKARAIEDDARAYANEIRTQSLGPGDIAPGAAVNGLLFFQLDDGAKAGSCIVRIPVGDAEFEFTFDKLAGN